MDTSHQRSSTNYTDEWYTPPTIFSKLGHVDLDPCSPVQPLWKIAETAYTALDDGLSKDWKGRVWLNPPYSRPLLEQFVRRMADHNNGIMLLFNRSDSRMFQEVIFPNATAMLFLKGRVKFYKPTGEQGGTAGTGSILFAFGNENAEILQNSGVPGCFLPLK